MLHRKGRTIKKEKEHENKKGRVNLNTKKKMENR